MPEITIERMRPEDIPAVLELHKTLMPIRLSCAQTEERYRALLQDENHIIFVARAGGETVGTTTAICCQGLTYEFLVIEDVVVRDDMHGRGVGRMLMDAADSFAREKGCLYAMLVSSGHRTGAHRFYEKIGYTENVRGFRKGYGDFSLPGLEH